MQMTHKPDKTKFLIIGLGPIGGIFACHLKTAGHLVCGIDIWEDHIRRIKDDGIRIEKMVNLHHHLDEVRTRIHDLDNRDFDYVVVSIKTPYMDSIIADLKEFDSNFNVVSLQNGIDTEDYLAKSFDTGRVIRIVVNYAGNITAPGIIGMSFFHKPNYVGGLTTPQPCQPAMDLARLLDNVGLDTEYTPDIKKYTWKKTILNSILAPLSALLGMTMAEIMTCRETRNMVELLLAESLNVADHMGYNYGDTFIQQSMDYLSGAGHHKPSMLIDIENGNPTEIDFINGKISEYGQRFNIPVPLHTAITALIKAKEQYPGKQ
jgi:2-dehydropantoate 2-reductase